MAGEEAVLSGAMPVEASPSGIQTAILSTPAMRNYRELAGDDFPWVRLNFIENPITIELDTKAGRLAAIRYSKDMTEFMLETDYGDRISSEFEDATTAGDNTRLETIGDMNVDFYKELEAHRWIASALANFVSDEEWFGASPAVREAVAMALEGHRVPSAQELEAAIEASSVVPPPPQTPAAPLVAVPMTHPDEQQSMAILRLAPLTDAYIQRRGTESANSARDALSDYGSLIQDAARQYGVDPLLMAAQIGAESGNNPNANSAYAVGLTQFIVSTWNSVMTGMGLQDAIIGNELKAPAGYAGEVDNNGYMLDSPDDPRRDPKLAILAQAYLLHDLARKSGGDMARAVTEYNAGPYSVRRALAAHAQSQGQTASSSARELRPESKNYYPQILVAYQLLDKDRNQLLGLVTGTPILGGL